jgi:hypothetical protein
MRGGETNGNMLDSNIYKGYGHQSSPSTSPLGRVREVRVPTRTCCDTRPKQAKKRENTHAPPSIASMGRGERGECKVTNRLSWCVATRPARQYEPRFPPAPPPLTCPTCTHKSDKTWELLRFQHHRNLCWNLANLTMVADHRRCTHSVFVICMHDAGENRHRNTCNR